jgi:hypothetical protein
VKHASQYIGLSPVGRNGTSHDFLHLSQIASNICLSLNLGLEKLFLPAFLLKPVFVPPLKQSLHSTGLLPVGRKGTSQLFPQSLHVALCIIGLSDLRSSKLRDLCLLLSNLLILFINVYWMQYILKAKK